MRRWRLSIISSVIFLLPATAHALGLGEIDVVSHLGQPLTASIDLELARNESINKLSARLGGPELHQQVGLAYLAVYRDISVAKQKVADGRYKLLLRSVRPLDEVILNFVVQVHYDEIHLLREYTVLLDPPSGAESAPAVPQQRDEIISVGDAPAAIVTTRITPSVAAIEKSTTIESPSGEISSAKRRQVNDTATVTTTTTRVVAIPKNGNSAGNTRRPASSRQQRPGKYQVIDGIETYGPTMITDSLGFVAREFRPDKAVNLNQLMMALYRHNPDAFLAGNINQLKAGYYIQLKDAGAIEAISKKEAAKQVNAHYQAWRSGNKLVSTVPLAGNKAGKKAGNKKATRSGRSNPAPTTATKSPPRDERRVAADRPPVVASRAVEMLGKSNVMGAETSFMLDRVAIMEERLLQLQQEYEAKSLQVANLQKGVGKKLSVLQQVPASAIMPVPIVQTSRSVPLTREGATNIETEADAAAALAVDSESETTMADLPGSHSMRGPAVLGTPTEMETDLAMAASAESEKVVTEAATVESSLESAELSDQSSAAERALSPAMTLMLLVGFIFMVVGAGIGMVVMKKRQAGKTGAKIPVFDELSDENLISEAVQAEAGHETEHNEIQNDWDPTSTMMEAKLSVIRGDPKHGVEILKHSLSREPRNEEYRLVLLEILFKDKNASLFGLHANIYADLFGKDTPAWERISEMGRIVAPDLNIFGATEEDAYVAPEPMARFITDETTGEDEELDEDLFTNDALDLLKKAEMSLDEVAVDMNLATGIADASVDEDEDIVMGEDPDSDAMQAGLALSAGNSVVDVRSDPVPENDADAEMGLALEHDVDAGFDLDLDDVLADTGAPSALDSDFVDTDNGLSISPEDEVDAIGLDMDFAEGDSGFEPSQPSAEAIDDTESSMLASALEFSPDSELTMTGNELELEDIPVLEMPENMPAEEFEEFALGFADEDDAAQEQDYNNKKKQALG